MWHIILSSTFEMVGRREIGLWFLNILLSPFYRLELLSQFSVCQEILLHVKLDLLIWLKILLLRVQLFFNKLVLIPSHPQLYLLGKFFIVSEINSASTGLKVKTLFILLFK